MRTSTTTPPAMPTAELSANGIDVGFAGSAGGAEALPGATRPPTATADACATKVLSGEADGNGVEEGVTVAAGLGPGVAGATFTGFGVALTFGAELVDVATGWMETQSPSQAILTRA